MGIKVNPKTKAVTVNNADVTAADNEASNGVVHIIDKVLLPPKYDFTVITNDKALRGSNAPPTKNIVQLAQSVDDLSTLVTAVVAANLTSTLSGAGPFTVFAPTNEAFADLPKDVLDYLLKPENKKDLVEILEYHVIGGAAIYSKDLKYHQDVKTVEGQDVDINVHYFSHHVTVNHYSFVTQADNAASNGVVHIINRVLIPEGWSPRKPAADKNIVQLAQSVDDLSTLVQAVVAANLTSVLSGPGPFTVFAPTNEAFAKLPAGTLQHLLKPENVKQLVGILEYHVVSGDVQSKDLKIFQEVKTLEGEKLEIIANPIRHEVYINKDAKVTAADNEATNGVVHIIDNVLIPK